MGCGEKDNFKQMKMISLAVVGTINQSQYCQGLWRSTETMETYGDPFLVEDCLRILKVYHCLCLVTMGCLKQPYI